MSRATFYACFPDKVAVIAGLAQQSLAWRNDVPYDRLGDPDLRRSDLDDLIRSVVRHWQQNRAVLAAIIEMAEHDAGMHAAWLGAIGEIGSQTTRQLQRHWAEDPTSVDDPEMLGLVLAWAFERSAHQLAVDRKSADRVAGALAEILWRIVAFHEPGRRGTGRHE